MQSNISNEEIKVENSKLINKALEKKIRGSGSGSVSINSEKKE